MKSAFILCISLLALSFWTSCADEHVTLNGNLYNSLSEVYAELAPPVQTFTINADIGGTVTGLKGTSIEFPADAFIDQQGAIVSGNVTVTIIEVLTESEMIGSGIYPINTNGDLLSSGGEIYINVSQDGERLTMTPGAYYILQVPAFNDQSMGVYEGIGATADSFWNYVSPTLDSLPFGGTYRDTAIYSLLEDVYTVISDILGWVNCDAFPDVQFINCNVHYTGVDDLDAGLTSVIFIADYYMLSAYPSPFVYDTPSNTSTECYLPVTSGYILTTTIKAGVLYFGITTDITPIEGATYEITLTAGTPDDLAALLDAL